MTATNMDVLVSKQTPIMTFAGQMQLRETFFQFSRGHWVSTQQLFVSQKIEEG